jgi:hypothetical protein
LSRIKKEPLLGRLSVLGDETVEANVLSKTFIFGICHFEGASATEKSYIPYKRFLAVARNDNYPDIY